MRSARIFVNSIWAGTLQKLPDDKYQFAYLPDYSGPPVSLTMPLPASPFEYKQFPPFFEGLLPEGIQLEVLLRKYKIDKYDYFSQLLQVGQDLIGAVTIEEIL